MKKEKQKFLIMYGNILTLLFMVFFFMWSCANTVSPRTTEAVSTEKTDTAEEKEADFQITAEFGSPGIDGIVDEVWEKAPVIVPGHISRNVKTTAVFRVLWDDNAIYVLAEVKDEKLSVKSVNPYMQDSLEIFLDEKNEKTKEYGVDDLHFRVNYENTQSVDVGDIERFYTSARKTEDGYLIEARVAFKYAVTNNQVCGIELQVNDATGADRTGTINVFDSTNTAWMNTGKFGEVLLTGKTDSSISGLNPYDLKTLIAISQKIDLSRYKNPDVLKNAIKESEDVLAGENVTQEQIDEKYANLKKAVSLLELTDTAANDKEFVAVPDEYRAANKNQGTLENLKYSAPDKDGGTDTKKMNVYLPYGYDAADAGRKYNVLYLMHGGSENENTVLGSPGQNNELKKIIDNMIAKGDIKPLIVVAPTFYGGMNDTAVFHEELINIIIPLIETKYNTYAGSAAEKDLIASREHRAFGGFSMGSVTTWNVYINCLDYIKYFIPLSGGTWISGQMSGNPSPRETAEYLANVPKAAGYTPKDYYLFCATGDKDIAYPGMGPQIEAMKEFTDSFIYSSDTEKGNFYFILSDGGTHAWNWVNQYIYDILPDLFSN